MDIVPIESNENEEKNCIIALKHQINSNYAKTDDLLGVIPASIAPSSPMDPYKRVRACLPVVKLPPPPPPVVPMLTTVSVLILLKNNTKHLCMLSSGTFIDIRPLDNIEKPRFCSDFFLKSILQKCTTCIIT